MEPILTDETKIKKELKGYCDEVNKYYKAGNIESSYKRPVIDLIQSFGCMAHDFSGAQTGNTGENIDIKLWHLESKAIEGFKFVRFTDGTSLVSAHNSLKEIFDILNDIYCVRDLESGVLHGF